MRDGVRQQGEDEIDVIFEWDAVESADGYEIIEESKYWKEEEFREPEDDLRSFTPQTFYISSAQVATDSWLQTEL